VTAAVLDADWQTLTPAELAAATAVTRSPHVVTPGWLRSHVRPANHASWDDCEAALLVDPLERRRIDELKSELIHRGFDLPMLVDLARRL
jgi:hypothetical protein